MFSRIVKKIHRVLATSEDGPVSDPAALSDPLQEGAAPYPASPDAPVAERVASQLVEGNLDGILAFDTDCHYTLWNARMEEMTSLSRDHVLGRTPFEVFPHLVELADDVYFRRTLTGETVLVPCQQYATSPSGQGRFFEGYFAPLRDAAGGVIGGFAVVRDVSARERTEKALLNSEALYRAVAEDSPGMICRYLSDGSIEFANAAYCELVGKPSAEVIGQDALSFATAGERDPIRANMGTLTLEEPTASYEREHVGADGETRWERWINRALYDEDGNHFAYQAFGIDITERMRALRERERLIAELEAKNDEMERFTYRVSHDLKSPLITISGFLGLLEMDLNTGESEKVGNDIATLRETVAKMDGLLEDLLTLARVGRIVNPPTMTTIEEIFDDALERCAGSITEREARITRTLASDLPRFACDRPRMTELFQNLIENALKYTRAGEAPVIELGAAISGAELQVWVRDEGIGIDPRYAGKIFELFEQIDPSKAGSGIGLATAKRIAEAHQGRLWAESEGTGTGTTFYLALPVRNVK